MTQSSKSRGIVVLGQIDYLSLSLPIGEAEASPAET
jgi:hypothetical protein